MGWLADAFGRDIEAEYRRVLDATVNRYDNMGREIVERARQLAPVETGQLRDNIGHEVRVTATAIEVAIHSDVFYAAMVELGTSKMEARPHLRPALAEVCARYGEPVPPLAIGTPRAGEAARLPGRGKAAESVRLPDRKRFG